MSHVKWMLLAMTVAIAIVAPDAADARDVKRCGVTIGAGKTGTLVGDVHCGYRCTVDPKVRCTTRPGDPDFRCPIAGSGCQPEHIVLDRNATLDLNGFDLFSAYNEDGVICSAGTRSKCTIKGPGNFYAHKGQAITPNDRDVVLKDLLIDRDYGGFTTAGRIRASNVTLQNCSNSMHGAAGVRAEDVYVGGGCGLGSGKNLYLDNVSVTDWLGATGTVRGRRVRGTQPLHVGHVAGRDVFLTDSQIGDVRAARQLVLRDSTAELITTGDEPALIRSSCMQSRKVASPGTWGICALD